MGLKSERGNVDLSSPSVESRIWPEQRDSFSFVAFFKSSTFHYMGKILDMGADRARNGERLTFDHLYEVPDRMKSRVLVDIFYKEFKAKAGQPRQLLSTLWSVAAPDFIPAGIFELIALVCQISLPLVVQSLLEVLEQNPHERVLKQGLVLSLAIFSCSFINAFASHRHRHLAMKSGIAMRAATVSVIYQHLLHLSPEGKIGLTSGEITNLVATDTQKLYEVAQDGHLAWALPLAMVIVSALLVVVLGWATLIGTGVLLLFLPIIRCLTTSMISIRRRRVQYTDLRVKLCTSMLQGVSSSVPTQPAAHSSQMKVTKLNNYEDSYKHRITEARKKELSELRKELAVWALTLVVTVISSVLATAATFFLYVLSDANHVLTASRSFTVLLLFSTLRFPISYAGRLLGKATQAYSAMQRISAFLARRVQPDFKPHDGTLVPLKLKEASFEIMGPDKKVLFRVGTFSFEVHSGEVVAVCGPVGGGKSTFINGLIGEISPASGSVVERCERVGYARQNAFIVNATVRDNILLGSDFDKTLYDKVISSCCLQTDFDLLGPAKDLTEIGERGVTLSGGQKQRVALARMAYASTKLNLLDDPFSALDTETGARVFSRLVRGPNAMLRDSAVVLVTHAAHLLNQVDKVVLVVGGRCEYCGTWEGLASFDAENKAIAKAISTLRSSVIESPSNEEYEDRFDPNAGSSSHNLDAKSNQLMTIEDRVHGLSSAGTWFLWFQKAGGAFYLSFQIIFMGLDRIAYVAVEFFLAKWTAGVERPVSILGVEFEPQMAGDSAQRKYLAVYGVLVAVSVVTTIIRSEWSVTGGSRAAKKLFGNMLHCILEAPLSYFETTPIGRLLNRFSYDMEVIDITLTQNMSMFMISCSWYVAGVCVMVSIIPWMALAIFPVTLLYWMLLLHYRRSGPDLQRLDALSRSSVQASVVEALDGAATIILLGQMPNFLASFQHVVDINSSALLNFVTAQRWLGFRIELLGSAVVLVATVLLTLLNDVFRIDAGLVGLLLIWSANFTITMGFLVDTFGEAEAAITAIERVDAMAHLPKERERVTQKSLSVAQSWPESGELIFDDVKLRYRPGLPLALAGLSFRVAAGKRCGIVGRTGAGKSSLTVALFRLVEIESGSIVLDGVDLSIVGLNDVRGRAMTIIPQDPFLAGDTVRECVDPFGEHQDDKILEALCDVRLAKDKNDLGFLNIVVEEGGSNFSVGERQLVFFARAMLAKKKVLVLDEATSSIDRESDEFIQNVLRTKFVGTTILTIAHRLETIIDFDQIVVLDAGKVVESGPPEELLLLKDGMFSALVDAAGPEASRALRSIASSKV